MVVAITDGQPRGFDSSLALQRCARPMGCSWFLSPLTTIPFFFPFLCHADVDVNISISQYLSLQGSLVPVIDGFLIYKVALKQLTINERFSFTMVVIEQRRYRSTRKHTSGTEVKCFLSIRSGLRNPTESEAHHDGHRSPVPTLLDKSATTSKQKTAMNYLDKTTDQREDRSVTFHEFRFTARKGMN